MEEVLETGCGPDGFSCADEERGLFLGATSTCAAYHRMIIPGQKAWPAYYGNGTRDHCHYRCWPWIKEQGHGFYPQFEKDHYVPREVDTCFAPGSWTEYGGHPDKDPR